MLGEEESKEEVSGELAKSKEVISDLESELIVFEEIKKDLVESERFLSQVAMELVELPGDANIYEFTVEKLKKLFDDAIILVMGYDEHSHSLGLRAMSGIDEKLRGMIREVLGSDAFDSTMSLDELSERYQKRIKKEFIKIPTYEAYGELFPEKALMVTDEILGVIGAYFIGLVWEGKIYGSVIVLMRSGEALEKKDTVETFGNMISVALQRSKAEKELKKSLEEKELLLKEIHHRVKNNLMIISSLLNLQSGYLKDEESKELFQESEDRARSMALIHERLYQSADLKNVNFGDYIQTLAGELFLNYSDGSGRINLKSNVEKIGMDINMAIPLGLVVNELLTNCLKYAFPEDKIGEIEINFYSKDDEYILIVKDNGIGLPEDFDYRKTDSLGMQLIYNLITQIDGKIELDRSQGTIFKITIPQKEI